MSKKSAFFIFFLFFTFVFYLLTPRQHAEAAISSCSASVTPTEIAPGTEVANFYVNVTNTDSVDIKWFRITTPSTDISPGVIYSDWSRGSTGNVATFTDGTLSPGNSNTPRFKTSIAENLAGFSGNWTVEVSDDPGGANPFNCTGTLGLTVTGSAPDTTGPVISGLSVSSITSSSAVVSWTTNEASTSLVKYDVSANLDLYPFSHSSSTLTTSHSVTVTSGIAPNTTYYYRVCSTDASSNQSCSSENSFTTASSTAATPTPTPTPTTTTTTTTTTATPAPVAVEKTPPRVVVTTDFDEPFEEAQTIKGRATDNKGVINIDYSIDGGQNWLPVDVIENLGARSTTFEFTPLIFEDGNYEIQVRAIDASGNTGTSKTYTLVFDRLPPRVGGNLLSLGPYALLPNKDGVIITMAGLEQRITLSAVGGPIAIDLLANERMFSLAHSPETGLWTGAINFADPGVYQLETRAIDGAGNKTQRKLNKVVVLRSGKVTDSQTGEPITEGEVKLFYQDPQAKIWTLWDARSFGQENPRVLDENGNYEYFLPPGTYYIQIKSSGFATLTSKIFSVSTSTPLNADFELVPAKKIRIGPFVISLPDFSGERTDVKITTPIIPKEATQLALVGKEAKNFTLPSTQGEYSLTSLRGQASVLTFISTWSPQGVEQILVMDEPIYNREISGAVVSSQESPSKVSIFARRGNYKAPIVIDKDGDLVADYNLSSLPTHYFLDRYGTIEKVVIGVLNIEEIEEILTEVR